MSLPPNGDAEMEAECEEMENNWAGEEEQAAVVHNIKVLVVMIVVMNVLMVVVVEAEAVVVHNIMVESMKNTEHRCTKKTKDSQKRTQITITNTVDAVLGIFWHS